MFNKPSSAKESAIGALMPTIATVADKRRFALSVLSFVDKPLDAVNWAHTKLR